MQAEITDHDRLTMLRLSVAKVDSADIRAALGTLSGQLAQLPKAVGNALNALRKHRDPVGVVGRAQYRPALPYVAAAIADPCLTRTIEVLGEHSDDPTREQLAEALDAIGDSFSDVTVAVMLASVADGEMPASDLCFDILANDERYGLTDWSEQAEMPAKAAPSPRESHAATPEQREARRSKRQEAANERRRRMEASRQAAEQVRRSKKKDRSPGAGTTGSAAREARTSEKRGAPRLLRRAALTPAQEEEFDRSDPWVAGVVFAWVPFDSVDPDFPDLDGKSRRCVVVAGSRTHLLVRPGYSQGGVRSRDWKSVPLQHWKHSGFDQPTWIDVELLRVPRDEEHAPLGWLSAEDWNSLW
jgi:hypothetical protein